MRDRLEQCWYDWLFGWWLFWGNLRQWWFIFRFPGNPVHYQKNLFDKLAKR